MRLPSKPVAFGCCFILGAVVLLIVFGFAVSLAIDWMANR